MDTKCQIHAGFCGQNSNDFSGPMCAWWGTNLSWSTKVRGEILLISKELVFTQIFIGVVCVFAYSLDVSAHVAVILLCDLGKKPCRLSTAFVSLLFAFLL